jgi:hypothetical protein
MGNSNFSYTDWTTHTSTASTKTASQIFTTISLKDSINPAKMTMRESCDSDANPNSTPIIIGLDFTGSMGAIPEYMIKEGLGNLFKEIYDRKPVSDPHVLFCGIGDVEYDRAPFQVGQFEAGCKELTDGLSDFWLSGCGGGGNQIESYHVPYYFAAHHTKCDSYLKRGKKGYIFTIGDEGPPSVLTAAQVQSIFGYKPESDVPFVDIIDKVRQSYVPYHIIVEQGSHVQSHGIDHVKRGWNAVMGENVIILSDYKKLSEVIVSILQVQNGANAKDVVNSWSGDTSLVVSKAVTGIVPSTGHGGLVRF